MNKTLITILLALSLFGTALTGCVGSQDTPAPSDDDGSDDPGDGPADGSDGNDASRTFTVSAAAPDANFTAAASPGSTTVLAVTVVNSGDANATVDVAVADGDTVRAGTPVAVDVPAGGNTSAFLPVSAAADADPGVVDVDVLVDGAVAGSAPVDVLDAAADTLEEGNAITAKYVGRIDDGRVFNTNVPAFDALNFPQTSGYQASGQDLTLVTGERANVPPALAEGLIGVQVGETRSVTLPPEDAFGPEFEEREEPRRDVLERETTFETEAHQESEEVFGSYLNETNQGNVSDYDVNDTFEVAQPNRNVTFRILEKADGNVTYAWAAEVGDNLTFPEWPWWPNATEVKAVDGRNVTLYTTPTTDVGEAFTYHDYWPNASAIVEQNETHVIVEHSPDEGLEYESPGMYGSPQAARVLAVEDEVIRVEVASPHPLAGETVVFDIHVLELHEEPPQRQAPQRQG